MTDPLEVADLIDKAHDELLTRGWCQNAFKGPTGALCSYEAIAVVTPEDSVVRYECAIELGRTVGWGLLHWNDHSERTEDEVFDAFRQTSKRLREQAG